MPCETPLQKRSCLLFQGRHKGQVPFVGELSRHVDEKSLEVLGSGAFNLEDVEPRPEWRWKVSETVGRKQPRDVAGVDMGQEASIPVRSARKGGSFELSDDVRLFGGHGIVSQQI